MAAPNRTALLTKTHRVLKKHYTAVPPNPDRPLLEQLLFALCLENTSYKVAEDVFAALRTTFFDWNEIRVSSIKELAQTMARLPDPAAAATSLRKVLQAVFESTYSFDLEALKKQNLGQAIERLEKLPGTTPFAVACVTQWSLGGHRIPVDRGAWDVLTILGIVTEANRADGVVPGMERAISKAKGIEFGSLLHQLAAEFVANRYAPSVHKVLLDIAPDAKARLPKRPSKRAATDAGAAAEPTASKRLAAEPAQPAPAKTAAAGKKPLAKPPPTERKLEAPAKGKVSVAVSKRKPR
jgi:endonuclease III